MVLSVDEQVIRLDALDGQSESPDAADKGEHYDETAGWLYVEVYWLIGFHCCVNNNISVVGLLSYFAHAPCPDFKAFESYLPHKRG